jgi:glycerol-3-phosphate dehydrogenase (NAD(P)+)
MKVTILGSGAYGIALALMFNENKCDITIWERFESVTNDLLKYRENKRVLPGVKIPENIRITSDLEDSLIGSDLIVIAIPAGFVDEVSVRIKDIITKEQHICIASKGIEQDTCLFVDDVVRRNIKTKKIGVISGPSFAVDMANYVPIGLTVASKSKGTIKLIKKGLENKTLKLRETTDVVGTEICGSIKNVIAIASGMLSGMNMPESTQAMFITESLHDIKELIKALDGDGKTVLSFAGFGDLLLTCTSTKSRNFRFGKMIGEKKTKKRG